MERILARYKVKPEKAQEHERLTAELFQELQEKSPDGVRCLVLKLGDGSYVHMALFQEGTLLHSALESFPLFAITISERCIEPPVPGDVTIFREYGIPGAGPSPVRVRRDSGT